MRAAILLMSVLSTFTLLTACSTYSREECVAMDWRKQGADTAMKGKTIEEGHAYFTRACRDVPVNIDRFGAGYKEALPAFCTPENIHMYSVKGGLYADICPSELVTPKFLTQYQTGREKYLEKKIKELESEVADARSAQSAAESRASAAESRTFGCEAGQ